MQPGSAAWWQGPVGCVPAVCPLAQRWARLAVLRQPVACLLACLDVLRDALRAAGYRRERSARLTGLHRRVACLLAHPGVLHDALRVAGCQQREHWARSMALCLRQAAFLRAHPGALPAHPGVPHDALHAAA